MRRQRRHEWAKHIPCLAELRRLPHLRIVHPCAGWDSPPHALHALRIPHTIVGLWEISPQAAKVLTRTHAGLDKSAMHLRQDGDVLAVKMSDLPLADLLICGPPCPPWSSIGRRRSWRDPRAQVFWRITTRIMHLARRGLICFVLEIVRGIKNKPRDAHRSPLETIVAALNRTMPDWHIEVLDMDSACTGQSRPRVYIGGHRGRATSAIAELIPSLPPSTVADIIMPGLPNTETARLSRTMQRYLTEYKRRLRPRLIDASRSGQFAGFYADRDPARPFAPLRIDGKPPCLRAGNPMLFIISLGKLPCTLR